MDAPQLSIKYLEGGLPLSIDCCLLYTDYEYDVKYFNNFVSITLFERYLAIHLFRFFCQNAQISIQLEYEFVGKHIVLIK